MPEPLPVPPVFVVDPSSLHPGFDVVPPVLSSFEQPAVVAASAVKAMKTPTERINLMVMPRRREASQSVAQKIESPITR